MEDIKQLCDEYISNTYKRFDLCLVKGNGSLLYDECGKEYIDLGSGIAVNTFGIGDKQWKAAVTAQLDCLQHTSNLYYTAPQAKLAELLCNKTGMKKVFFSNSGAEANECLIKAARKYSTDKYGDERNVIITLKNSFHGRTVTTLSATGQDVFHKSFYPFTEGFEYVEANNFEAMAKAFENKNVCAVLVELVQGEGGVVALDKEYIKKVYTLAKEKDILFAIDEVQTGNGRSGTLYAYMQYDISPDIVSTAKGLAGGLPMGATLFNESTENVLSSGDHGSTFGANPICAAGAVSIISRIDDALLESVKQKSKYIIDTLSNAKGVESISGLGLMLGIKTQKPAAQVVKDCMDKGVLVLTAKDKVRLLPALNIPISQLEKAITILKEVIEK